MVQPRPVGHVETPVLAVLTPTELTPKPMDAAHNEGVSHGTFLFRIVV